MDAPIVADGRRRSPARRRSTGAPSPPCPRDAVVIAADGGLDHARAAGLDPAVLVGDLDSISALGLAWASEHAEVVRHPVDKAATDTELAIAHAATLRARRASCSSPARATASTTPSPRSARSARRRWPASRSLEAWWGSDQLHVVHGPGAVDLDLPAGHDVLGARHARPVRAASRVDGARWPLDRPRPRPARRPRRQQRRRRPPVTRRPSPTASSPSSSPEPPREPPPRPRLAVARRSRAAAVTPRRRRAAAATTTATDGAITLVDLRLVPDDSGTLARRRPRRVHRRRPASTSSCCVAGDTGTMVSKAVLTAGNPEGDVMFGVDNTFLSRVVDADVFEPYEAAGLDAVPAELRALVPDGEATPDRLRRRVHQLRQGLVRGARPRPAGRPRRAGRPGLRRPARRREPGVVVARAGVRAGHDRRVRRGRLDRLLGAARATTASRSSTAGRTPTTSAFSGAGDGDRAARRQLRHAARRPRSSSPTRRSTRRRPASSTRRASARSSSPACCAAPSTPTRPGSSSTSCSRERFQAELPLNLFVYPANARRRRCPRCSPPTPRVPADPTTLDPATIAANREAWIDDVDRHRPALTPTRSRRADAPLGRIRAAGVRSSPRSPPCRPSFLAVFYAWPFATLLARGLTRRRRSATRSGGRRRGDVAWFTLWQAVAQHGADGRRRARPGLRARPLPLRRPAAAGGAADGGVRAADRRDGRRRARPPARRGWERGVAGDPARPRHVQPGRRRAHGRRRVGAPARPTSRRPRRRSARRRGGRSARSRCRCCARRSSPPASIVFVFTFTSFGVIRVLGDAGTSTIEVEIWRQATQLGDIGAAATLAVLQLARRSAPASPGRRGSSAATAGPSRCARWPAGAGRGRGRAAAPRRRRRASPPALVVVAPLVALVERSLRGTRRLLARRRGARLGRAEVRPGIGLGVDPLGADRRRRCARRPWPPSIAVVDRRARRARHHRRPARRAPARHRADAADRHVGGDDRLRHADHVRRRRPSTGAASWWLVPVGQALVAVPFVVRTVLPVLRGIDPHLHEAAATLGASPTRAWREVTCRTCAGPLIAAAGLAAAISLGEFGATSFLSRSGSATMPIAIERLLGRAGALLQAQGYALATILAAVDRRRSSLAASIVAGERSANMSGRARRP